MSISVQAIYEQVASGMGRGTDGERLSNDFIYALNAALNELSSRNDLATKLTNVTDVNDTITDVDDNQFYILTAGTRHHLKQMGHYSSDPKQAKLELDQASSNWTRAADDYWTDRVNALNAGDSQGVIGNGYLTQK
jgi:hypothetical protein